jgi:uncharacterized membrane protein YgdD (TMEM256/DUF423 family)
MDKKLIAVGALFGATSIILGAFGAHALKVKLPEAALVTFETGVRYQMYHALFLILCGILSIASSTAKKAILWLTTIGVVFFSGSIYFLATQSVLNVDFKFLGPVTPIGGLLLIAAWIVLLLNILKPKR